MINPNQGRPAAHLRTVKVSSKLAQDRRAWGTSISDVVSSIGDTGSTRPVSNRSENFLTMSSERLFCLTILQYHSFESFSLALHPVPLDFGANHANW